jgi:hypothetical protein
MAILLPQLLNTGITEVINSARLPRCSDGSDKWVVILLVASGFN